MRRGSGSHYPQTTQQTSAQPEPDKTQNLGEPLAGVSVSQLDDLADAVAVARGYAPGSQMCPREHAIPSAIETLRDIAASRASMAMAGNKPSADDLDHGANEQKTADATGKPAAESEGAGGGTEPA